MARHNTRDGDGKFAEYRDPFDMTGRRPAPGEVRAEEIGDFASVNFDIPDSGGDENMVGTGDNITVALDRPPCGTARADNFDALRSDRRRK